MVPRVRVSHIFMFPCVPGLHVLMCPMPPSLYVSIFPSCLHRVSIMSPYPLAFLSPCLRVVSSGLFCRSVFTPPLCPSCLHHVSMTLSPRVYLHVSISMSPRPRHHRMFHHVSFCIMSLFSIMSPFPLCLGACHVCAYVPCALCPVAPSARSRVPPFLCFHVSITSSISIMLP